MDRIYGFLDQGKVEIPSDEVTTVLGIQTSPLKLKGASNRHDINHSSKSGKAEVGDDIDVAKVENDGSDNWKIECDPDLVKSEETPKDDEDRMNYNGWTTDDNFKVKEQGCDVDEEQTQGCLSLFHEY